MSKFQLQTCPNIWLFLTDIPHKASISSHGSFSNSNSCIVRSPEVLNSCTSHCSQAFVNWKAFSLVYFRANVSLCSPNTCYSSDLKGQKYCRAEGCNHSSRRRGARLWHPSEPSISVICFPPATWSTGFLIKSRTKLWKMQIWCPAMSRGSICKRMWSISFLELVKEHLWP